MPIGLTQAGTITRETLIPIVRIGVAATTTVTKGQLCKLNTSGFLVPASTTAETTSQTWFVALETGNNSAGANGDVDVACAQEGHFVTVVADGAIRVGDKVKPSTTTAGRVIRFVLGTDAGLLAVGKFRASEGGIASITSNNEAFTDVEEFGQAASAAADIIEIYLGAAA